MNSVPAMDQHAVQLPRRYVDLFLICLVPILLRAVEFNFPWSGYDEQFYLYVGGQMLDGQIPFVDIWDRKPIGLFLIFALANIFGNGIIAYHLMALIFVILTSFVIYRMALYFGSYKAALLAAIAYPIWTHIPGGAGGQAPVFYNLFVALAALITLQMLAAKQLNAAILARRGALLMLLIGIAIQIKYTAMFEGIFFGITLLWLGWKWVSFRTLCLCGMLWIFTALLPTIVAIGAYWVMGYFDEFMFANFYSIFLRGGGHDMKSLVNLLKLLGILLPLILLAAPGIRYAIKHKFGPRPNIYSFAILWVVAAIAGILIVGTYNPQYGLAAIPSVTLLSVMSLHGGKKWQQAALLIVILMAIIGQVARYNYRIYRGWPQVNQMLSFVEEPKNCPFLFDAPTILYQLGRWCAPTKYVFTGHLNMENEAGGAIGVDATTELNRIMSYNPHYVITRDKIHGAGNNITFKLMAEILEQRYDRIGVVERPKGNHVVYKAKLEFVPLPNQVVPGRR